MTSIPVPNANAHPLWKAAQAVGVLLTVALLAGLMWRPHESLHVLWNMVIPLLPAVFLVNPLLWRNVCPLATLNEVGGRRRESPAVGPRMLAAGWAVGVVLLLVLVPARHVLFNEHGSVLAATIGGVAALALAGGFVASRRAGFCNTICPVLPVEKLYGQSPLLTLGSSRCAACNRCTPTACPDLAGRRSLAQSVSGTRGASWLVSPVGILVALFPGFIYGYFTTADGPLATAGATFGTIALWSGVSLVGTVLLVVLTRLRTALALLLLGGASVGMYYWFAAPRLAEAYGASAAVGTGLRVLLLGLVVVWLVRALRREAA
jgi:nitrite reductase (NADH) large subunit